MSPPGDAGAADGIPSAVRIERIDDRARLMDAIDQLTNRAQHQVCSALPGGPWSVEFLRSSWDEDIAMLARGLELKEVITPAAVNTPAALQYYTELSARGVQVRMTRQVFQRAILIDRRVAVVSVEVDSNGGPALIVREPTMLLSLYQQFEGLWRAGNPIGPAPSDVLQVEGVRQVLQLLADGLTDEAIARRLQLSHRTVQRRVSAVMEMLGSCSRFAAGARAQELGWL